MRLRARSIAYGPDWNTSHTHKQGNDISSPATPVRPVTLSQLRIPTLPAPGVHIEPCFRFQHKGALATAWLWNNESIAMSFWSKFGFFVVLDLAGLMNSSHVLILGPIFRLSHQFPMIFSFQDKIKAKVSACLAASPSTNLLSYGQQVRLISWKVTSNCDCQSNLVSLRV